MYKKLIATVTAACFLFSFVFAPTLQGAADLRQDAREFEKLSEGFALPSSAGRITGGRDFGSSLAVVSIQDLHCHGEVQRNIERILSALDKKCGVRKIYVEGAAGSLDTTWLSGIADEKLKSELVETLVDEGRLTGAEYYSARAGKPGLLNGLEDETVYAGNLARLGRILEKKEEFAQATAALRDGLAAVKKDYFGRENKRFDALLEKHRNGKISAVKYYHLLMKYAEKMPGGTGDYPTITGYLELMESGKRLHYRRIARQLQEYMRVLKEQLPFEAYNLMLEKTGNFSKLDEMYLCLLSLPRQYRAGLADAYPQLAEFLAYTDTSRSLNPLEMVREEKRLVGGVRRSLSRSAAEKEVAFLADFSGLFEEYLNNRLSAEDYRHFADNFDAFKLLWPKYTGNRLPVNRDDLALLDAFYRVNLERNACFVKNVAGELAGARLSGSGALPVTDATLSSVQDVIVIVTGGFHTLGLEQLLAARKITYVSVTPNVTKDTKTSDIVYGELARHQANILSQAFALHVLSSCDPAEKLGAFFTAKIDAERKLGRVIREKNILGALAAISRVWDASFKARYGEMNFRFVGPYKQGGVRVEFTFKQTGKTLTMGCEPNGKVTYIDPGEWKKMVNVDEFGLVDRLYDVDGKWQMPYQLVQNGEELFFFKGGRPLFFKNAAEARVKLAGPLAEPDALRVLGDIDAMPVPAWFKADIRTLVASGKIRLIEDNENVLAFRDRGILYIAESLARRPSTLFHELGEFIFDSDNRSLLPRGIGAHYYLAGCSRNAREVYATLTSRQKRSDTVLIKALNSRLSVPLRGDEKALIAYNFAHGYAGSPLDGLQDKVFGPAVTAKPRPSFAAAKQTAGAAWIRLKKAMARLFAPPRPTAPAKMIRPNTAPGLSPQTVTQPVMDRFEQLAIEQAVRDSNEPLDRWFDGEMTAFFKEMRVTDGIMTRNAISLAARRLLERYRVKPTPSAIMKAVGVVEDTIRADRDRVLLDKDTQIVWVKGDDPYLYNLTPFFQSLGIPGKAVRTIKTGRRLSFLAPLRRIPGVRSLPFVSSAGTSSPGKADAARQAFLKAVRELPKNGKSAILVQTHGLLNGEFRMGGDKDNPLGSVAAQDLVDALAEAHRAGVDLSHVTVFMQSCFSYEFADDLMNRLSAAGISRLPTLVASAYRNEVSFKIESFIFKIPETLRGREQVRVVDLLAMHRSYHGANPTVFLPQRAEDILRIGSAFENEEKIAAGGPLDRERTLLAADPEIELQEADQLGALRSLHPALLSWASLDDLYYRENMLLPGTNVVEGFMGKVYDTPDGKTRELQDAGVSAAVRGGYVYFEKSRKALYTKDGAVARVKLTGDTLSAPEALRILGKIDTMDIPAGFKAYIRDFVSGQNIRIIEDNEHIRGFHDGTALFITRALAGNPVALFHELGEGYFGAHPQTLPREMSVHTYLRGCGQDARAAYEMIPAPGKLSAGELVEALSSGMPRPLTPAEELLINYNRELGYAGSPLDGLQDKVFGAKKNRQLSDTVSSKMPAAAEQGLARRVWSRLTWSVTMLVFVSVVLSSVLTASAPPVQQPAVPGTGNTTVVRQITESPDARVIEQALAGSTDPLDVWFDGEMRAFFKEMNVTDSVTARNSISFAVRRILERYMLKVTPSAVRKATKIVEDTIRANKDRVLIDKNSYVISVFGDNPALAAANPAPLFSALGIGADSIRTVKATSEYSCQYDFLKAVMNMPEDRPVTLWIQADGEPDSFHLGGEQFIVDGESISIMELSYALSKAGTDLSRVTIFFQSSYSYDFAMMLLNRLGHDGVTRFPTVVTQAYRDEVAFTEEALAGNLLTAVAGRDSVTVTDLLDMQQRYRGSNPAILFPATAEGIAQVSAAFDGEEKIANVRRFIDTEHPVDLTTPELQKEYLDAGKTELILWGDTRGLYYGGNKLMRETTALEGFMGKVYSTPDESTRELLHDGVKAVARDGYVYFEKSGKALFTKDGGDARVKLTGETLSGAEILGTLGRVGAMDIPAGFKEYIRDFTDGQGARIFEDNGNISGFHDGTALYIAAKLAHNPVALFHELGEGYFGAHTQVLPRGVNAHTYLRGCGQDARNAYEAIESPGGLSVPELEKKLAAGMHRPLTYAEKALIAYNRESRYTGSPLDGLQDRVFGAQKNRQLSGALSPKVPPEPKQSVLQKIGAAAVQAVLLLLIVSQLAFPGLARSPITMEGNYEQILISQSVKASNEPLDRWFDGEMTSFFKELKTTDSIMARNSISLAARRLLERYLVKPTPSSIKKATAIVEDMIRANKDRVLMDENTYVIATQGDDPMFNWYNPKSFFRSLGIGGDSLRYFKATSENTYQYEFLKAVKEMPKDRPVSIWICNHGAPDTFKLGGEKLIVHGEEISTKELAYAMMKSGADLSRVSLFFESCYSYDFAINLMNDLIELGVTNLPTIVTQSYRDQVSWMAEDMSYKIPRVIGGRNSVTVADMLGMQALYHGSNPAIIFPTDRDTLAGIGASFDGYEKLDASQRYLDPEHVPSFDTPNDDLLTEFFMLIKTPAPLSWGDLNDLDFGGTKLETETTAVEGFIGKVYDTADTATRDLQRSGVRTAVRDGYAYFEKNGKPLYTKDGEIARVKLTGETVTGKAVVRALGSLKKMKLPPAFKEYIAGFANVPFVRIIEDNGNIRGFNDGKTFFITRSLMRDPVALFHELGEGYFGAHKRMLPRSVGAHTYLRGCGQDARNAYDMLEFPGDLPTAGLLKALAARMDRPLTPDEKALIGYNREMGYAGSPLDGLQDKVFGAGKNLRLSKAVSSKVFKPAKKSAGHGIRPQAFGITAALLIVTVLLLGLPVQRGPEPVAERPEISVTRVVTPGADRQTITQTVKASTDPLDQWFDAEMTSFFDEMQVTDSITARNSVSMAARRLLERFMVKASPSAIKTATGIVLDTIRENKDQVLIGKDSYVLSFQGDDPSLAATNPAPFFRSLGIGKDSIQEITATSENPRRDEFFKALKDLPKDRQVAVWINAVGQDYCFDLGGEELIYEGETVTTYEMAFALAQAGPDLSHVTVFLPSSYSYDFGVMLMNYLPELGVTKLPVVVVQAYRGEESFASESLAGALPNVIGDRDFVTVTDVLEMQKLYRGSNPAIIFPSSAEDTAKIGAAFSGEAKNPRTRSFYNGERSVTVTTPEQQRANLGKQPGLLSWTDLGDLYYGSTKLMPETTAVEGFMGKVYSAPDEGARELQYDGVTAAVRDGCVYFEKGGKQLYTKDGSAARVKLTGKTLPGKEALTILGRIDRMDIPAGFRDYIRDFVSGHDIRIIEDNANIQGFHDGATLYVTASLAHNPVALFHELGEGYFGGRKLMLPRGVSAHTYLRGCGQDARSAYALIPSPETLSAEELAEALAGNMERPLTSAEKALIAYNRELGYAGSPLDGLQDRVFGPEKNRQFSSIVNAPAPAPVHKKSGAGARIKRIAAAVLVMLVLFQDTPAMNLALQPSAGSQTAISRVIPDERWVAAPSPDKKAIELAVAGSSEPLDKWFDAEMTAFFKEINVTDTIKARNSVSRAARRLLERYMVKPTPSAVRKAVSLIKDTIRANKDRVLLDKDTYVISVLGDDKGLASTDADPFFAAMGITDVRSIKATSDYSFQYEFLRAVKEMPKDRKVAIWIYAHGAPTGAFYLGGSNIVVDGDAVDPKELAYAMATSGADLTNVTIFFESCFSYDFTSIFINRLAERGVTGMPTVITQSYRTEVSFTNETLSSKILDVVTDQGHAGYVTVADILDMQQAYRGSDPAAIFPAGADAVAAIVAAFAGEEKMDPGAIDTAEANDDLPLLFSGPEIDKVADAQRKGFDTPPALLSWGDLSDLYYGNKNVTTGAGVVEGFIGKVFSTPDEGTRVRERNGVTAAVRDGFVCFEKDGKALYTKDGLAARVRLTGGTVTGADALKVLGNVDAMDIPSAFKDYIRAFIAGQNIRIIEDNGNIRGFHDGTVLYVTAALAGNPVALFHELGEGYFGGHPQALPRGMSAHTYLRGCGQDARATYEKITSPRALPVKDLIETLASGMRRELTSDEKALIAYNRRAGYAGSPLDGMQDKVFGAGKNRQLSNVLSAKVPAEPKKGIMRNLWSRLAAAAAAIVIIVVALVNVLPMMDTFVQQQQQATPAPSPTTTITRPVTESDDRQAIEQAVANSIDPLDTWFDGQMRAFFKEMNVTDSIMARNSVALAVQRLMERFVVKPSPAAVQKATEIVLDSIRANKDRVLIDQNAYVISVTGDHDAAMASADPAALFRSLGIADGSVRTIGESAGSSSKYALFKAIMNMPKDRPIVIWINADVQEHYGTFSLGGTDVIENGETVGTNELAQGLASWNKDLSRVTVIFQPSASYDFATTFVNCFTNWGVTRLPTVVTQSYRDEESFANEALSATLPEVIGDRDFVTVADLLELQKLYHGSNPAVILPASADDLARVVAAFQDEEKITARRYFDTEKYVELNTPENQAAHLAQNESPDLLSWSNITGMYYGGSKLMRDVNAIEGFMGKVYDSPDEGSRELQHEGVQAAVRDGFVYFEKDGKALYTKDGRIARAKLTGGTVTGEAVAAALGTRAMTDIPQAFKEYIEGFRGVQAVRIIEDNGNIDGFNDGRTIYITRSLMQDPVALFHELGEGFFGANRQLLPRGVNAHTYLRGCGKDAREAYRHLRSPGTMASGMLVVELNKLMPRPLTAREISLIMYNRSSRYPGSPLDGLQDKVFGKEMNERLSVRVAGAVPAAPATVPQGVANALNRSVNPLSPVMQAVDGITAAGRRAPAAVPVYAGRTLYDFNELDRQEEDFFAKAGMTIVRVREGKIPGEPTHRFAFPLGALAARFAGSEGIDESGLAGIAVRIDRLPAGGAATYAVSFDCPLLRAPGMTPEDTAAVRARAFFALADYLNVNKKAIAVTGQALEPDVVVFGENERLNDERETLSREAAGEYAGARIQDLFGATVWVARLQGTPDSQGGTKRLRGADLAASAINGGLLDTIESRMKRKYAEAAARAQQDLFVRVTAGRGFDGDEQKLTAAARVADAFAPAGGQGRITLQLRNVFDGDLAGIREDCIDRSVFPSVERLYEDGAARTAFESLRRRYAPLLGARTRPDVSANERLADDYMQVQGYEQLRRAARKAHAQGGRFVVEYAPSGASRPGTGAALIAVGVKLFGIDGIVLDLSALPDVAAVNAWTAAVRAALPDTLLAVKAPAAARGAMIDIAGEFGCMRVEEWNGLGELPRELTGHDVLLEVAVPENADAAMLEQIASRLEDVRAGNISVRYVPGAGGETAYAGDARQLKPADILRFFGRMRSLQRDPFTRGFTTARNVREADIPELGAEDLAFLGEPVEMTIGGSRVRAPRLYVLDRVFRTIESAGRDGGKLLETDAYLRAAKAMIEAIPGFEHKGWKFAYAEISGALAETDVTAEERARMNLWLSGFYRGLLQRMAVKQYCAANERTDLPFADNGYRDRDVFAALLSRSLETLLDASAPLAERAELARLTRITVPGVSPAKEKPGTMSSPALNAALDLRDPASLPSYLAMLEGMVSRMRAASTKPVIAAKMRPYLVPLLGAMQAGTIDRPGSIAALLRIYQLFDDRDGRISLEAPVTDNLNLILGTRRIRSAA